MTNNYFKVVASSKIRAVPVMTDPESRVEGEDEFRNIAAHGYVGWQEFFFFDDRDPTQIRQAFAGAEATKQVSNDARLSMHRKPLIGGPWDEISIIGVFQ